MAKPIKAFIKLYCPAGAANPAPPVGPALGQHGVNIMEFCKKFNEQSKGQEGLVLPVVISVYDDRSFSFIIKSPPVSVLIKQACGIAKASGNTPKEKAGQISRAKIEEIAKTKMQDVNTIDLSAAIKMIEGTARSMGIDVVDSVAPATEAGTAAKAAVAEGHPERGARGTA
jgi:large subunit ribosomal protein L11